MSDIAFAARCLLLSPKNKHCSRGPSEKIFELARTASRIAMEKVFMWRHKIDREEYIEHGRRSGTAEYMFYGTHWRKQTIDGCYCSTR